MDSLRRLAEIVSALRSPEGCPWDRAQTLDSLRPFLLEECYEVLEALDRQDYRALAAELGDLLLQVFLEAQVASESGLFDLEEVAARIADKLERRHPHVFAGAEARTPEEVLCLWRGVKLQESAESAAPQSRLDGIPRALPALQRAQKVQGRAAAVGFDWQSAEGALTQLESEAAELRRAQQEREPGRLADELGDVLFSVVNVARFLGVDAEAGLRQACRKFEARFRRAEQLAQEAGRTLEALSAEELDRLWQQAKQEEARAGET
jgi:MazG family protein